MMYCDRHFRSVIKPSFSLGNDRNSKMKCNSKMKRMISNFHEFSFMSSPRRGINLPCNGFPYSKIPFSDQTRLGVINSQSKSHSNDHKMGVIEQKDQKKLRNSEKTRKTRMGISLDFVKNAFYPTYTPMKILTNSGNITLTIQQAK